MVGVHGMVAGLARLPLAAGVLLLGCVGGAGGSGSGDDSPADGEPRWRPPDTGAEVIHPPAGPGGQADAGVADAGVSQALHHAALCGRDHFDTLHDLACNDGGALLDVGSLSELYALLRLDPAHPEADEGAVLTAHTTALSTRSVSAINPRAILVRRRKNGPDRDLMVVAFTRGEQLVEMAVRDRQSGRLRFYVLAYSQACNARAGGCLPGELLTDATESDWAGVALYDDGDLQNTVLDCAPCHQQEGPEQPPVLRMVEAEVPFTHWLWRHGDGGRALLADYEAAWGHMPYAGIPWERIYHSEPGLLASVMRMEETPAEPIPFDGARIESEVQRSVDAQPYDNSVPGYSATWELARAQAVADRRAPLPYHDVKVTDPERLAFMTASLVAYREGRLPLEDLPDIRDVLPRDPQLLADMGLRPDPALRGAELVEAACGRCHNDRLDQDLSRARFNVADFIDGAQGVPDAEVDPELKARILERLGLDPGATGAMPPPRLLGLSAEQRTELVRFFESR